MIEIKIDSGRLTAELDRLGARLTNMTPAMGAIAEQLESSASQAFQDQRSADGTPWKTLEAVTLLLRGNATAGKRKKFGVKGQVLASWQKAYDRGAKGGQILRVSGSLEESIGSDHGADFASVSAGSGKSALYAMMHQFGGTTASNSMIPGKPIPARPYLPIVDGELAPAAEESCLEVLMQHMQS